MKKQNVEDIKKGERNRIIDIILKRLEFLNKVGDRDNQWRIRELKLLLDKLGYRQDGR